MSNNKKRKIFPVISRHQIRMVFLVFLLTIIMHMCLFTALSLMQLDLFEIIMESNPDAIGSVVDRWSVNILIMSGIFMVVCLICTYLISRNLVGSFGRIIREMDEVLSGEKTSPIVARKYDWLAKEVLERVNAMIEKMRS